VSRVSQPETVQLLITSYNRKKVRLEVSLDLPFPDKPQRKRKPPVNLIQQALNIKAHMAIHPGQTYRSAAMELNIDRKRISKLIAIMETLPPAFIEQFKDCDDPKILHRLSVQRLSRITSLSNPNSISQTLNNLQL